MLEMKYPIPIDDSRIPYINGRSLGFTYLPGNVLAGQRRDVKDVIRVVKLIAETAKGRDVPACIAAAMICNAGAESNFDPEASGDANRGYSYGLFQCNLRGVGKGHSSEYLINPVNNINLIIDEMNHRYAALATSKPNPSYKTEHPLVAYERGVRDVVHLTAMFMIYVERPEYNRYGGPDAGDGGWGDGGRRFLAAKWFPQYSDARWFNKDGSIKTATGHPYAVTPPSASEALPSPMVSSSMYNPTEGASTVSSNEPSFFDNMLDNIRSLWSSEPEFAYVKMGAGITVKNKETGDVYGESGNIPAGNYDVIYKGKVRKNMDFAASKQYSLA